MSTPHDAPFPHGKGGPPPGAPRLRTTIVGSGSHIPEVVVPNAHFLHHDFRDQDGEPIGRPNAEVIERFREITGIRERRYAGPRQVTTDLASDASAKALESAGISGDDVDAIIVAHNFGDVRAGHRTPDLVPSIAARVKARLGIRNPRAVAFDLVFGCPGWLQGVILADSMIRAGDARRVLVVGADTLSRISDPHDRDSMIYADGAGAVMLEGREGEAGVLATLARTDAVGHADLLTMGASNHPEAFLESIFLKMEGRKVYRYALGMVAAGMSEVLEKAGVTVPEVKKFLIHQANGKMDEAILQALFRLHDLGEPDPAVLPLTISWLGNASVATIPTLIDLIVRGRLEGHTLAEGDLVVLASVGAGMHINAAVVRWGQVG